MDILRDVIHDFILPTSKPCRTPAREGPDSLMSRLCGDESSALGL